LGLLLFTPLLRKLAITNLLQSPLGDLGAKSGFRSEADWLAALAHPEMGSRSPISRLCAALGFFIFIRLLKQAWQPYKNKKALPRMW